MGEVAAWLDERRPATFAPGIMHGDYHAANVMFSRTGPEVVAIVDWEMCTIGDPLLDLGWLLATWELPGAPERVRRPAHPRRRPARPPTSWSSATPRASDRDLAAIDWYVVLACFKLGIILEGTYARALAGKAPMEIGDRLHPTTLRLFDRAQT